LKILISNDDGVNSEGLKSLYDSLSTLGKVIVIAPDRERSAVGHSLTLDTPLRLEKISEGWFSVNGTPADCINMGLNHILKGEKPDVIVSGINKGGNLGNDVTYSGTVSAAMEGTIFGIPSIAVSLVSENDFLFNTASQFTLRLTQYIYKQGLPDDTLLNVNVPNKPLDEIKGVKITKQGKRIYNDTIIEKVDPRKKNYYWIGGNHIQWIIEEGTDYQAIQNDEISITPLHLDMTNHKAYSELLDNWELHLS
jgi:5'-nucleotidase